MVRRRAFAAVARRALAVLLLATALPALRQVGAQEASLEYAVKATYLYKFAPFVEWPDEAPSSAPLELCVAGADPFGPQLDRAVGGQPVGERPVNLRRLDAVRPDDGCQIVYLADPSEQSRADALAALRGEPVLTVTDDAHGPGPKGIIHFVILDNRVRFEIDGQAASAARLKISSKLLDLAVNVRRRN